MSVLLGASNVDNGAVVAACMSVLLGACNVDNGPSMELTTNVSLDCDANRDELLLAILWEIVEMLFMVLGKQDARQLFETGAKLNAVFAWIRNLSLETITYTYSPVMLKESATLFTNSPMSS